MPTKTLRCVLAAALLFVHAPVLAAGAALEVQELVELQKQKQFGEVLARGLEVLPSARNSAWREAVEAAMLEELARLQRNPKAHQAMRAADETLARYAHLSESAKVQKARAQLAAKAWDDCLAELAPESCTSSLVAWSRTAALPAATLLDAAGKLPVPERAERVTLTAEAVRVEPAAVKCDAEWLNDALIDTLTRHGGSNADIDAVVAGCGARLGKPALTRLLDSSEGLTKFCPKLLAAGLSGVQKSRCERGGKR